MIQSLSVHFRYRNQPIRIDTGHHAVTIQIMVTYPPKKTAIPDPKLFASHLTSIQISKRLKLILIMLN